MSHKAPDHEPVSPERVRAYRARVSGPILDRLDLLPLLGRELRVLVGPEALARRHGARVAPREACQSRPRDRRSLKRPHDSMIPSRFIRR